MANSYFQFKQFTVQQDRCAMKVTTDGCLFGAWAANEIRSKKYEIRNVLDIGTGTGLLTLLLAQKNNCHIDAIEIDRETAEQAAKNIEKSPWADRIRVLHTNAIEFRSSKPYDLIISNPPFYENELKSAKVQKNIAHHSDELRLKDLLKIIKKNLSADGIFCLLLPYKRNAEVKTLLAEKGFLITQMIFVRQSTRHDFFRIMIMGKLNTSAPAETIIDEIAIKDENNAYTPDFKNLLKDYYLHL
jgi:tRNA1Val (adenine37-N6)-methyltransferase